MLQIIRPPINPDKRQELETYLLDHYERAREERREQVDDKYARWQKLYYGVPQEAIRNIPWYKSSNFVVKLVRIFADTFLARTLNIIFATRPLYVASGFPAEVKDALEAYLNHKALNYWNHYSLARALIHRGNKNGTAVVKTPWIERDSWTVEPSLDGTRSESKITLYAGPLSRVIPFEDFNCWPLTVTEWEDVKVKFHTLRYVEETVRRKVAEGVWTFAAEEELERHLRAPGGAEQLKRLEAFEQAGVGYRHLRELECVECHLEWPVTSDPDRYYSVVALLVPDMRRMVDLYFNPFPRNLDIFSLYCPYPRDDVIFGESLCELLDQAQEEASSIHNDRRNNSTLANSVCFKRRSGSLIPNPSTNWYPGKVWDLESMDDLEPFEIGRNYTDTINEEQFTIQLAMQLSGISDMMIGGATGAQNRKGVYNAQGTLGIISESNQRQDTNIRDVRMVLSQIVKQSWCLQQAFGKEDPVIDTFSKEQAAQIRAAFGLTGAGQFQVSRFDTQASDAGANKEVHRQNLLQMAQVLAQYGQAAVQMSAQLANPQLNPVLRAVMNDTVSMMRAMARELLRAFDEGELEGMLPDVGKAVERILPGGSQGTAEEGFAGLPGGGMDAGGGGPAAGPLSLQRLQSLASLPGAGNGSALGPGVAGGGF